MGLTLLVLGAAAAAAGGGLASLAFGIHCFTQDDPGATCGVLTAAVPLTLLPLGAGLSVIGLGLTGRLVRERDEAAPGEAP